MDVGRRAMLALSVSGVAIGAASKAASPVIAIGGVAGFADLADANGTARLRRQANVRLYIHNTAWIAASPALRRRVLSVFGSSAPCDIELGEVDDAAGWFAGAWRELYLAYGVRPGRAHVNVSSLEAAWETYVHVARQAGFRSVSPILTPNLREFRRGAFDAPVWSNKRDAARAGGGITTDSPVTTYFDMPEAYRKYVAAELAWARSHGLWSAFIVSPGRSGQRFASLLKAQHADLKRRGCAPDEYIVENYEPNPPSSYVNMVGSEAQANSIAGVSLWLRMAT